MSKAQLCPVCLGTGKKHGTETVTGLTCNGCNGKGWVEVQDGYHNSYVPDINFFPKRPKTWEPWWKETTRQIM